MLLLLFCCLVMFDSLCPHGLQYARLPCPSLSPRVCSNSCPLSQWCHPTISSSAACFYSCSNLSQHQGLFKWVSWPASGGQSIGASTSASVLPMNIQGWFPLGLTGLIFLLSKELSRVFSSTKFKNNSSSALSLLYVPTLTTIHDYSKNHNFDYTDLCRQIDVPTF